MKKCLSMILVLSIISCLISVSVPSVSAAENDSYYYYSVKVTTKIDGDIPSEELVIYYSLHGANVNYQNFVLSPYSVDGNPAKYATAQLQPGETEQTNIFVFCSEEPVIGVRLLQESNSSTSLTFDENEYYIEFLEQTQQPGLENAMHFDQLCLIEGFENGGTLILSELREPLFTLKYNAPPVFSGVEDGGEYFTTQKVRIQDTDMVSVMLDDRMVEIENGEATVILPGDIDKSYTITVKDAVRTCQLTVTMHELNELMAPVSQINENNVKSEHKDIIGLTLYDINAVIEQEPNPSTEENARLDTMKKELESLLSRIDEALENKNSDSIKNTKDITADNVTLADKEALEKAESDLKKALEEYGENYSDSEKKALQEDLTRVSDALKAIEEMTPETPATGDNSHFALWLILFILSGVALVTTIRKIA